MRKFISLAAGLLAGLGMLFAEGTPTYSDLIISQYLEGNVGNNKYIELYNGTDHDIDLSAYTLKQNTNNSGENKGTWGFITALSGTIKAGSAYVFYNEKCGTELTTFLKGISGISAAVTASNNCMSFNGNDPIGLFKGETLIDVIGTLGSTENYGKDVRMTRKCDATAPKTEYDAADWESVKLTSTASNFIIEEHTEGLGTHCGSSLPADEEAPKVDYVVTSVRQPKTIEVHFTEALDAEFAAKAENYTLDNEATVASAALITKDNKEALILTTAQDLVAGKQYILTMNVKDVAGNSATVKDTFSFGYVEVASVAELVKLRDSYVDAQKYRIKGECVVAAIAKHGQNIYIQDKDCKSPKGQSVVLYDKFMVAVKGDIKVGDVITGVTGSLTIYQDMLEMQYLDTACIEATGTTVEPAAAVATIYDINNTKSTERKLYYNALVQIRDVEFADAGKEIEASKNKTYSVEDADNSMPMFIDTVGNPGFVGNKLPEGKGTLVGYITVYNSKAQIVPRTMADIFPETNPSEGTGEQQEEPTPGPGETANENAAALGLNVYPNPAHSVVNVEVKADNYRVNLYNFGGVQVLRSGIMTGKGQINVEGLASGVYMLEVMTPAGNAYTKVILR